MTGKVWQVRYAREGDKEGMTGKVLQGRYDRENKTS